MFLNVLKKTKEVPQLADLAYTHTLVIKSTCEYKVGTMWPMDLVFMSTFDDQSTSIGCVGKLVLVYSDITS